MGTVNLNIGDLLGPVLAKLERVERKQDAILRALAKLERTAEMITTEVQELVSVVEEQTTVEEGLGAVIDSTLALLGQIQADLQNSHDNSPAVQAAVAKIKAHNAALTTSRDALTAALTANTPTPPEPQPVEPII